LVQRPRTAPCQGREAAQARPTMNVLDTGSGAIAGTVRRRQLAGIAWVAVLAGTPLPSILWHDLLGRPGGLAIQMGQVLFLAMLALYVRVARLDGRNGHNGARLPRHGRRVSWPRRRAAVDRVRPLDDRRTRVPVSRGVGGAQRPPRRIDGSRGPRVGTRSRRVVLDTGRSPRPQPDPRDPTLRVLVTPGSSVRGRVRFATDCSTHCRRATPYRVPRTCRSPSATCARFRRSECPRRRKFVFERCR
jgi:hypothetical protein